MDWSTWKAIEPVSVEPGSTMDAYVVSVRVTLNATPPLEWQECFAYVQERGGGRVFHGLKLSGNVVSAPAPEADAITVRDAIYTRIKMVNALFEREYLPDLRGAQNRQQEADAERERRLRTLRDKLNAK